MKISEADFTISIQCDMILKTRLKGIKIMKSEMKNTSIKKALGPRDEWSFKTHVIGIILSVAATVYLIIAEADGGASRLITFTIYGLSMIALYTCSSIYHYSRGSKEHIRKLRTLDHSMIYVLIVGSYTPVLYNCLPEPKGTIFLVIMWSLAIIGIVMKMFWLNAPRWLYTSIYIVMGWAIVFDFKALMAMDKTFLILLLAGGLSYTAGAILYIVKKPNIFNRFGFHEIFHVFILLGTIIQFIGIAFFL